MVSLSPQIFSSHPYIRMGKHLFESSGEIFNHIPKTYWCGLSSFLTPPRLGLLSFFFYISHTPTMQCNHQKYLSVPYCLCTYHIESHLYHIDCLPVYLGLMHKSTAAYKPKRNIFMHLCTVFILNSSQLDINFNIKTDVFLLVLCIDPSIIFAKPPS